MMKAGDEGRKEGFIVEEQSGSIPLFIFLPLIFLSLGWYLGIESYKAYLIFYFVALIWSLTEIFFPHKLAWFSLIVTFYKTLPFDFSFPYNLPCSFWVIYLKPFLNSVFGSNTIYSVANQDGVEEKLTSSIFDVFIVIFILPILVWFFSINKPSKSFRLNSSPWCSAGALEELSYYLVNDATIYKGWSFIVNEVVSFYNGLSCSMY